MKTLKPLPQAQVPFFMSIPFQVKADMYRFNRQLVSRPEHKIERQVFELDTSYPAFVMAKLDALQGHPEHSRCVLRDDEEALSQCFWQVARCIAADQPDYFSYTEGSLSSALLGLQLTENGLVYLDSCVFPALQQRVYEHLQSLALFEQVCDFLALCVQEDLVIMHKTGSAAMTDRAECLLVALPSHWDPLEKCGLDFAAIHHPVADNAALLKAHPNVMKAMVTKGPFVRYNWSFCSTPALAQNPTLMPREAGLQALQAVSSEALVARLHFRVERQTFYPFPELKRALFAIRIYQEPLEHTLAHPEQKEQLLEAVSSMSAAMRQYKGIEHYQDALIAVLSS